MGSRLTALGVCVALAALSGCGSSSSGGTASTPASASTATTATTTSSTPTSSLKVGVKPKFAKATGAVRSGTVRIAYRNIAIEPDTVRVKVGSKIVWTNYDTIEHDVTSEGGPQRFASGPFGEGRTFSIVVAKPGVIHYESTGHPATMNGTIEVIG